MAAAEQGGAIWDLAGVLAQANGTVGNDLGNLAAGLRRAPVRNERARRSVRSEINVAWVMACPSQAVLRERG